MCRCRRSRRGYELPAAYGIAWSAKGFGNHLTAISDQTLRCKQLCIRCDFSVMPTTNRRHAITETEDIACALDLAGNAWPDLADKPGVVAATGTPRPKHPGAGSCNGG